MIFNSIIKNSSKNWVFQDHAHKYFLDCKKEFFLTIIDNFDF